MLDQYKLAVYCIAALFLVAFLWKTYDAIGDSRETKVRAEYAEAAAEQERATAAKEAADRLAINQKSEAYETENAKLRRELAAKPASVVRVCNTNARSVPRAAAVTSEPQPANPVGLGDANGQDNSIDIGRELDQYKEDAQRLALRCNAILEAWPK